MDHSIGNDKTSGFGSGDDGSGYALNAGDVLGQYRVVRQLGRGGMGQVYEVEHTTLGRRYALKLLPQDFVQSAQTLERFKREARVMANLEHPNIIRVDEFGETDGRYWLRMELVEGVRLKSEIGNLKPEKCVTLADLAKSMGGKVPQEVLLPILKQVLAGLDYAHSRGAVHRDLKPSNILLTTPLSPGGSNGAKIHEKASAVRSEANKFIAKIADFGLVKLVGEEWIQSMVELSVQRSMSLGDERTVAGDSDGTSTKSLLGTYEYMSPEQKRGEEADARSDIYSVGLLVYKLLTGEELGMRTPSQLDSKLNRAWDELVLRALEARPERRFQSVTKMMAALKPMECGGSTPLSNQGTTETELTTKYTKDPKVVSDSEEIELTAKERKEHKKDEPVAPVIPSKRKSAVKGIAIGIAVAVLAVGGVFWWQGRDDSPSRPENAVDGASSSVVHQRQDDAATTKLEASSTLLAASPQTGKIWTAELGGGISMEFMPIAAGSFMMGSENGYDDEKPVHRVTLTKLFWMAKTEVTQAQWRQVMGSNPSCFKGDTLPVEHVRWNDAMEFCRKLTEIEQRAGRLPAGFEYTLPTEAQWEYACRAGTTGDYAGTLDAMAWYDSNSGGKTHPVGTKQANAWGLHDMHGNVWEWCSDWYGDYSSGNVVDPQGASSGSLRVQRGGSWYYDASYCRSANRDFRGPSSADGGLGFRPLVLQR
ncbi:MAG: SUMF1/EgtB/PvdO family nonheme iron enzyme [Lentisphaerae bacterium]|nr:SUMF1/EgtB/PvdO family nonheme iron enzyme [Lentisphaerota bacterium]